jgi:hypothetical protein
LEQGQGTNKKPTNGTTMRTAIFATPLSLRTSLGLIAVGLIWISVPPLGWSAAPTVRVAVERSTNRTALVTWGPPQAVLQCATSVTGPSTNVAGAAAPYRVDTRQAPAAWYRACLAQTPATVFIWRDTILRPGRIALEWTPRDWRLQETRDFVAWQNSPAPVTDWYFPSTLPEVPAPQGVLAAVRHYRIVPASPAPARGGLVYSVNVVAHAVLSFQVGQSNFFSFPLLNPDRDFNRLLPFPPEAHGSIAQFYDAPSEQFILFEFHSGLGWIDCLTGGPALRPAGESAC